LPETSFATVSHTRRSIAREGAATKCIVAYYRRTHKKIMIEQNHLIFLHKLRMSAFGVTVQTFVYAGFVLAVLLGFLKMIATCGSVDLLLNLNFILEMVGYDRKMHSLS